MSFDIYLIPLQPIDDFESAMLIFDSLDKGFAAPKFEGDARLAADVIMQLDTRYRPFQRNFPEIARYERISEVEARERHDSVLLNGMTTGGEPMAHFEFHRDHVVVHWYSGTTPDELDQYIVAICKATGLAAVDPQESSVLRLQADGTLG